MANSEQPSGAAGSSAQMADALKREAGKLADKPISAGVGAADAVGKAAESAAQVLEESLPSVAGYVRDCARYTERLAEDLRDKKAQELLSSAITWSRQQPLIALAGAAVLGFALSRVAKAGLSETSVSTTGGGGGDAR